MKTQIKIAAIALVTIFFVSACNTGVKLVNNCNNPKAIKVVVLPFKEDDYNCNNNLEELLRRKCYDVEDGQMLIAECSMALRKSVFDLTIEDLVSFAETRGIDKIIYGTINYAWTDVFRSKQSTNLGTDQTDKMIEGNYAILDGYCIDTKSNKVEQVIFNHRVKKIKLGMPEMLYAAPGY